MTLQKTNRTSIMASFATLKSLSDAKKYQSPYQLLSKFINYIILSDSLYSFSAVEMKNRLEYCLEVRRSCRNNSIGDLFGKQVQLKNSNVYLHGCKCSWCDIHSLVCIEKR